MSSDRPPLKSPQGCAEPASRRHLLHVVATVAASAPLAALSVGRPTPTSPVVPANAHRRIRRAVLVPRFGGDAAADWYPAALRQLADLGIRAEVVPLLPAPTRPEIDETVAAIAKAVESRPHEIGETVLIGHSIGSRALLAYLSRHGANRTFAGLISVGGWFKVDDMTSYPAVAPWVNMDLEFASIAAAAGPIAVHLSDNDPYTADWRSNAADWLGKLGATVHIAHGAGHFMTTSAGPVLDTVHLALLGGHHGY